MWSSALRKVVKDEAEIGGPRAKLPKMNAGEKQIDCTALRTAQIPAGIIKSKNCPVANLGTSYALHFCWSLFCTTLMWGRNDIVRRRSNACDGNDVIVFGIPAKW